MIYRKEIDGLRALAVLPVVFFHAGFEIFSGGYIGVDIFLVISGYLITSIIFSEQEKGCFSLLSFYERRARRILPALFLVIFISIIFSYLLMTPGQLIDFAESVIASSLFISNFHFLQEAGYFSVASELKPLLHTWSLAIEEQFYIFYPLILVFLLPFGRKITIIFLIFSFIFSLILSHFLSSSLPSANYYLIPTRAWELLMGCLAAFYLRSKDNIQIKNNFLRESFSFFGALVLFSSFFIIDNTFPFPSFWTLLPTLGTFLIIVYGTKETLTGRFLGNKIFVSLGLISYSLYLWHQPIFAFSRIVKGDNLSQYHYLILILASIGLSYISWKYLENFFREKKLIDRKSLYVLISSSILLFLSFSVATFNTNGFKDRYEFSNDQLITTNEEFSSYVQNSFNKQILVPFDSSIKLKKLLIIGDSYARDLFNILLESDLKDYYQVSSHLIHADCGALFLKDYSAISTFIDSRCSNLGGDFLPNGRFEDKRVIALIKDSDEIWITHSFNNRDWLIEFLPQSLDNLRELTTANVTVYGHKDFGKIDFKKYLLMTKEERVLENFVLDERFINQNILMQNTLHNRNYINLLNFYCDNAYSCKLFDANGFLLSYDGSHLTKEGAIFFGKELSKILNVHQ